VAATWAGQIDQLLRADQLTGQATVSAAAALRYRHLGPAHVMVILVNETGGEMGGEEGDVR
jgi:hypothetical protein